MITREEIRKIIEESSIRILFSKNHDNKRRNKKNNRGKFN